MCGIMTKRLLDEVKFWIRHTNDSLIETVNVVVGQFGIVPRGMRQYYADLVMLQGVREGWWR